MENETILLPLTAGTMALAGLILGGFFLLRALGHLCALPKAERRARLAAFFRAASAFLFLFLSLVLSGWIGFLIAGFILWLLSIYRRYGSLGAMMMLIACYLGLRQ